MPLASADLETLQRAPAWRQIMDFYWQLKPGLRLMKLPWVGERLQKAWLPEDADANWILPVGAELATGRQMVLPGAVVERLLAEADGIFRMHACPCRVAFKCQQHPWDLGCLHLGPSVHKIPTELGRRLSREEGRDYAHRALAEGLLPTVLQVRSEAEIFRLDPAQMLSVCFCCECCCDVRLLLRDGPNRYWDLYTHRLPGLTVVVGDACNRCGACQAACYGGERVITLGAQKAIIHDRCMGCGRCVATCPQQALSLEFDPRADSVAALLRQIRRRVEISAGVAAEP